MCAMADQRPSAGRNASNFSLDAGRYQLNEKWLRFVRSTDLTVRNFRRAYFGSDGLNSCELTPLNKVGRSAIF